MKLLLLPVLLCISAEKTKRTPQFGSHSNFPTFFSAATTDFGSSGGSSKYPPPPPKYPAPAPKYPAPAPKYPAPAPKYPAPAPASYPSPVHPAPSYHKPAPTHNCSVKEETSYAEVCVPGLAAPQCGPVTLKGVQVGEEEKCVSITRTVCSVSQESVTEDVCTIEYVSEDAPAEATLVEVTFSKECSKQMVTVCEQGYHSQSYGYSKENYQKCEELAQETCYNRPQVAPKTEQVTVRLPAPRMSCSPQTFSLPTVDCQEVTEEMCVSLPSLQPGDVEAEQCTVALGEDTCQQISLTLPVQVCREQLYGEAHKAPAPAPAHAPPAPSYG